MTTSTDTSATPALGDLLSQERKRGGSDVPALSIRALAKRAGISAAQLSRIESGQVSKPGPEILTSLARALNRNPLPLLILAGHVEGKQAQEELRTYFFREGAEVVEIWGDWTQLSLQAALDRLHDDEPSEEALRSIAADLFRIQESDETIWDDAYNLVMARGEDAADLRRLMGIWRTAGEHRKQILRYAELWQQVADLEYLAEVEVSNQEAALARARDSKASAGDLGR